MCTQHYKWISDSLNTVKWGTNRLYAATYAAYVAYNAVRKPKERNTEKKNRYSCKP